MKVKSESEVDQSCPTLSDHMDCSLPGSSVHGISQARVLEWVALPSPRFSIDIIKSHADSVSNKFLRDYFLNSHLDISRKKDS